MSSDKPLMVICGSIAIDRIMNFQGRYRDLIQPDKMHVLSISMLLDKLENSRGGVGANVAYNLAQLGEKPALIGSVGEDAQFYIEDLDANGIDTSRIHTSHLPTASFNVITDSEGSQVGGFYQGAMYDSDSVSFRPWQGQNIVAMICAHKPTAMNRQVEECRQLGFRLVYDPGQQVASKDVELAAGVAAAEVLFLNDYEMTMLSRALGQTAEEIKRQVPIVVTTLGREGSVVEGGRLAEPVHVGICQVDPVDPTGAGDAYRAGFMYGYLRDWELKQCGQLGATLASFIVERHGTQQPLSREVIKARYKENFNEEVEL